MNVLSLCSGIGGLDRGLHLAFPSAQTVCYVEIDPFCQNILLARMADGFLDRAPIWGDLHAFDGRPWRGVVDCVASGFPCQPFSVAGKRQGAADPRNLWPEVRRVISESEPAVVILENVPGALPYFFHVVLPELQGMGYATQAGLFTAAEVGAPHRRQRVFVLAYSSERAGERGISQSGERNLSNSDGESLDADVGRPNQPGLERGFARSEGDSIPPWPPGPAERDRWTAILARWPGLAPAVAYTPSIRGSRRQGNGGPREEDERQGCEGVIINRREGDDGITGRSEDSPESQLRRVADGISLELDGCAPCPEIPNRWHIGDTCFNAQGLKEYRHYLEWECRDPMKDRMHRLRALGNAVVPAQASHALRILARRAWTRLGCLT